MRSIEDVMEVIKEIDCPEEQFLPKVIKAFDGYNYQGEAEVIINREEKLDREELKGYRAYVNKKGSPHVVVMVDVGLDHYVKTVEEVYLS
jgi:hypothetical protein